MIDTRRWSLPIAFACVGAALPLLVLWSSYPANLGAVRGFAAWAFAVSMLSGLVSGCVGVLARDSRSWPAFIAIALALGSAFGTAIAVASFQEALILLPLVLLVAVYCAGALTVAALAIFSAHRRRLAVRPGSLLEQLEHSRLGVATAAVVLGAAWLVNLGQPSLIRLLFACAAGAATLAFAVSDRRSIRTIRALSAHAGAQVEGEQPCEVVFDLGTGEQRRLAAHPHEPYRNQPQPLLVIRGSVERALHRAAQVARGDAVIAVLAGLAIAHMAFAAILSRDSRLPQSAAVQVQEPPKPIVRTGSWYPDQEPILVDINHDGSEEIVSLRWDSSDEKRALFVSAHDGASLRPLWATDRIPSQWLSPHTELVRSGEALFLSDSERQLHIYDLATGLPRRAALELGSVSSLCAVEGDPARIWVISNDAWRNRKPGTVIDADGRTTQSPRPEHCRDAGRRFDPSWDASCAPKLRKTRPELAAAGLERRDQIGLVTWIERGQPHVGGYDPATCKLRWESPQAFGSERLHHDPKLRRLLADGVLYALFQLEDGRWQVGARAAKSGEPLWFTPLLRAERGTNLQDLFVGKRRVYAARDWQLDVLERDTGAYQGTI